MSDPNNECRAVEERLAELLELLAAGQGLAPLSEADVRLVEHISDCDRCRDLRFEAERSIDQITATGADFELPPDFEARLFAKLHLRETAPPGHVPNAGSPQPQADDHAKVSLPDEHTAQTHLESTPALPENITALPENITALPENITALPENITASNSAKAPATALETPNNHSARAQKARPSVTVVVLATLAVAAAIGLYFRSSGRPAAHDGHAVSSAWSGTVSQVERSYGSADGLVACQEDTCRNLSDGDPVEPGDEVRTDGRTRTLLLLRDGSSIALNRETSLRLLAEQERSVRLERGGIVADILKHEGEVATVHLPLGRASVLGTKFALHATSDAVAVGVSRGEVRLEDAQRRSISVRAGQEGRLARDSAPRASTLTQLSESFEWSDRAFAKQEEQVRSTRGLGELRAQKPGEKDERAGAVSLTRHSVKIRLVDNLARTEVEEVFTNHTNDVLEGIFRFPLPADAKIERLALEVDGRLEEGAFVERERASAIWRGAIVNSHHRIAQPLHSDEIVWVPGPWKDPALLEWQRGGRFELRVFPIPKQGSRRVVLAYTQMLPPAGSVRRYSYPLAHDPSGSTRVQEFSVDLQVRGHEGGVQVGGYALNRLAEDNGVAHLAFQESGFVPRGDLEVEYSLPSDRSELSSWVYRAEPDAPTLSGSAAPSVLGDESSYVAISVRPNLPRWDTDRRRAYVLAVDVSRSMFGEQYRRAIAVMRRMIAEMDEGDVVTVLACHAECEPVLDGFSPPSLQLAESAYRKLEASAPEGASDLIETIRSASELVRQVRDRDARVVLIGDGSPTVGAIHPAFIRSAVSQLLPNQTTVSAVTVGADADLAALQAVTETAGGSVLQYSPGQSVAEVAYDALAFTYGRGLRNAQLILPEGLTQVAPSVLGTIPAGGEALVVARMPANNVRGKVVLRGTLGDQRFEQSYDLELTATSAAGNAFVPRVFAATHIAELDRSSDEASRRQSVALSGRYNVASRYTSLLVLESPAMFKAFGLDNERRVAHWTGEEDAEGTSAEGDVGFETDEASADGDLFDKAKGSLDNPASGVSSGFDRAPSAKAKSPSRSAGPADESLSGGRFAPPPASAPRAEKPTNSCPPWDPACQERESDRRKREVFPPRPPPRQLIPMRRVWERTAEVNVSPGTFDAIREDKIRELSRRLQDNALDRSALKELYSAYLLAGDLGQATELAERWSAKDPMDIDALTARADLAAQRGDRRLAIRILGSVVDVRPGEHKAQWRLARLHRWAGRPEQGCSHSVAVAQIRPGDARLLSEALRCTRATGQDRLMADLGRAVTDNIRRSAEQMLNSTPSSEDALSGDFRLEADWSGAEDDLDLVLIHPDGYRVSWLGAPTRAVISATDVLSVHREGLALRGAEVGEYAVEVVRANPSASPVRGNLRLRVGSRTETIPFYLEGTRSRLARVKLRMQSSLVPL